MRMLYSTVKAVAADAAVQHGVNLAKKVRRYRQTAFSYSITIIADKVGGYRPYSWKSRTLQISQRVISSKNSILQRLKRARRFPSPPDQGREERDSWESKHIIDINTIIGFFFFGGKPTNRLLGKAANTTELVRDRFDNDQVPLAFQKEKGQGIPPFLLLKQSFQSSSL